MGWRVLGELRGGRSGGVEAFGIVAKLNFYILTIHLNERVTRNCNQSRSKFNASTVLPNN